ncbi:unnamed protein product [Tilletia laevis]|uniref:FAD-binding PCMH-type domain-containing protein n=3 Tax=Tilletia TaxID=13289 RepID=A0A8X7MZK3_9BASI|nr:hypothetical protein CF336_g8273 [Tilletia laevis]KAE8199770.1 hypothetical protein CF328_g3156 [Tilletia controversa]KAE8244240.1 hypothetical protein A4X03_0g7595 [Tilletia caries]KAE8200392.1 hypothetical protein CF335_g3968 [Tilletia laevis]KAE8253308.1 hypothetical protein A4X06_0g1551 [Tilletia controversa]
MGSTQDHSRRRRRPRRSLSLLAAVVLLVLVLATITTTATASPVAVAVAQEQRSAIAARYAHWDGPPPPHARREPSSRAAAGEQRQIDPATLASLQASTAHAIQTRQRPHLTDAELPPLQVPVKIKESSTLVSCIYNMGIKVHTPADAEFWNSAQSDNLNYHYLPLAVAFPNATRQVSDCVRCAVQHGGVPVAARSGGHSFSGSGSGGQDGALVIDLAKLDGIVLSEKDMHDAYIGPGARLGDVVKVLWQQGKRAMTHGTCPTVGVGGHALCGGFGPLSRAWGLAADAILGMDVILADGSFALVDPVQHRDLLWGMRGAGNHFGIVTCFSFKTQDVGKTNMTFIEHSWHEAVPDARAFAKLLDGITAWAGRKDLPSELGFHLQITPAMSKVDGKGDVMVRMRGIYNGPQAAAEMVYSTLWPELRSRGGDTLAKPDAGTEYKEMNWLDMMGEWDDFGAPGDKLNTAKERLEHNNYVPKTTLIRTNPAAPSNAGPSVGKQVPLDAWQGWASMLYEGARNGVGNNRWSWNVFMELFGGHNAFHLRKEVRAVSSIPFVDGMWLIQQTVGTWPGSVVDSEGKSWVRRMHESLRAGLEKGRIASSSYGCYQDPDREDWLEAFHGAGEERDRLFVLKDRYDPLNLFRNPQNLGSKAEREARKKAGQGKMEVVELAAAGGESWSQDIHPLPR